MQKFHLGQKVMYDSSKGWVPAEVIEFVKLLGEEHARVQIDEAFGDLLALDELCEMQEEYQREKEYQKEQKTAEKIVVGQKVMAYFKDEDLWYNGEVVETMPTFDSGILYCVQIPGYARVYRYANELREMQKEQKPMEKFVVGQKVMVYFEDDDLKAAEIVELHRVENSDIQYARLRMSSSGRTEYRFTDELREMQEEQQKEQKPMKEKLYRVFYQGIEQTRQACPWGNVLVHVHDIVQYHVAHAARGFEPELLEVLEVIEVKVDLQRSLKVSVTRA